MNAEIRIIDNQTFVALPASVAERLGIGSQNEVGIVESPNGVELIGDLEQARQLEIARGVMRDDREALAELAK